VRSKKKVLGENALIMFTYNFKRLLNLIGIGLFKKLCLAIKNNDLSQIREDIARHILRFMQKMAIFLISKTFYRKIDLKF
jgi:predicted transposase YbfD/YdcC